MAFTESIRNVEELKEEANKDVHKKLNDDKENTLQAAMAIEIQVKTAITLAGHAASKTKELSLEQMQKITIRENEKIITNPIRLLVLKEKCVDENNLALTFIRCLTEFLTGLNKSFFCLPSKPKVNEAVLLLETTNEAEGYIVNYGCEIHLKVNRPFIFVKSDGNVLLSKKLVAKIYNDSSTCLPFEFTAYLKALVLCIVPAAAYACLLFVLITYLSIFSYSNDVAGYVVSVATYLQLVKYKVETFLRDLLLKDSVADPRFLEKLRKHLDIFTESWIVTDYGALADPGEGAIAPIADPHSADPLLNWSGRMKF
uniref:Uncharacterized protein n=1 Tax=Biomphalaria glabrata TaxID=6526 RepID=A0A2C9KHZ3_BIOGL